MHISRSRTVKPIKLLATPWSFRAPRGRSWKQMTRRAMGANTALASGVPIFKIRNPITVWKFDFDYPWVLKGKAKVGSPQRAGCHLWSCANECTMQDSHLYVLLDHDPDIPYDIFDVWTPYIRMSMNCFRKQWWLYEVWLKKLRNISTNVRPTPCYLHTWWTSTGWFEL